MLTQAFIADDLETFYRRLDFIYTNVYLKVEKMQQQVVARGIDKEKNPEHFYSTVATYLDQTVTKDWVNIYAFL